MKSLVLTLALLLASNQGIAQVVPGGDRMVAHTSCRMLNTPWDGGILVVLSAGGFWFHETAKILENQVEARPLVSGLIVRSEKIGRSVHYFDQRTKGEEFSLLMAGLPQPGKSVRATLVARTSRGDLKTEMICSAVSQLIH